MVRVRNSTSAAGPRALVVLLGAAGLVAGCAPGGEPPLVPGIPGADVGPPQEESDAAGRPPIEPQPPRPGEVVEAQTIGIGARVVFVSRQIPDRGTIYWDVPRDLPGVGPHSRARPAAPGKLLLREMNGQVRALVDGARPVAASLFLIDVNAPAVSYNGRTIVFAGLRSGAWDANPAATVGGWRLYAIEADGTGLRQVTMDEPPRDCGGLVDAAGACAAYDDFDPVFLPDGRICFASTRWPSVAQYSGVRTSNLHVVNADGTRMHRITSERNGAERPLVDPVTGRIVYARWWRNHRFPTDDMRTIASTLPYPPGGFAQRDGLTGDRNDHVAAPDMWRNAWHAASIRTDGTELAMFAGVLRDEDANHAYGGAFAPDGTLFANYFPMANMTEAAGFGGVRRYPRGPNGYAPVLGITRLTLDYVNPQGPTSYGVFRGEYAAEPEVLPDGRLLVSIAPDVGQDYGLYVVNADGTGRQLIYDAVGTTELRARVVAARPARPILPDRFRDDPGAAAAGAVPPPADGPFVGDGTFVFKALNVYANAPVDVDIVSAPAVGSAGSIRFFIDHQRGSPGSFPNLDWPVLLGELPVAPDGSVTEPFAPSNVPLFEQLRSPAPEYRVPTTGGPYVSGAAHVAGMNFAPPGATARCVGCHAGHTLMTVPDSDEAARWSNVAPGAALTVSSSRDARYDGGLIDRRVRKGEIWRYWMSASGQQSGQWVRLSFRVPVTVQRVRLYNPRPGDEANASVQVNSAVVRLFADASSQAEVATAATGALAVDGTDVAFADVRCRTVQVDLTDVTGTMYGMRVASLAEVEVIARGEAP